MYDSHEYFTEVPELVNRPEVKKIWEWLEQKIVPHIKHAYTVCESIAKIYEKNMVFLLRWLEMCQLSRTGKSANEDN